MRQRVGTCSRCGGDVLGYRGAWQAVIPPPPDRCSQCGAVRRADVIEMVAGPDPKTIRFRVVTGTGTVPLDKGKGF